MKAVTVTVAFVVTLLVAAPLFAKPDEILTNQPAQLASSLGLYHPDLAKPAPKIGKLTPKKGKWLLVVLKTQMVHAYSGSKLTRSFRTCTGRKEYPTPPGNYRIYQKIAGYHKVRGKPWSGIMYNPVYFSGCYALHGSSQMLPRPSSHGCCRLYKKDADWLFKWAPIGTNVIIVSKL